MSTRSQVIELLSKPYTPGSYQQFKDSIECDNIDELDIFLRGIICSLFYKPNHKYLALSGDCSGTIPLNLFPRELIQLYVIDDIIDCEKDLFKSLLIQLEKPATKVEKSYFNALVRSDAFKIVINNEDYPSAEKRLASFVFIQDVNEKINSSMCIQLDVKSIELAKLTSVDTLNMWKELFNRFKPTTLI